MYISNNLWYKLLNRDLFFLDEEFDHLFLHVVILSRQIVRVQSVSELNSLWFLLCILRLLFLPVGHEIVKEFSPLGQQLLGLGAASNRVHLVELDAVRLQVLLDLSQFLRWEEGGGTRTPQQLAKLVALVMLQNLAL